MIGFGIGNNIGSKHSDVLRQALGNFKYDSGNSETLQLMERDFVVITRTSQFDMKATISATE